MKYYTDSKEGCYGFIECFDTLQDAEKAIEAYEKEDMETGCYTPNFYIIREGA